MRAQIKRAAAALLLLFCLLLAGCQLTPGGEAIASSNPSFSLDEIPPFSGEPYVVIDDNVPSFLPGEMTTNSYKLYSPLDDLGRCGTASACVGIDLMPTEERESIGQVKPAGWHTVKYDCVEGGYLYNRCHLIGHQLSGENANKANLITGTRYLNMSGMLPFENLVADYVKETENHVLYRVTPIYEDDDLLARGVQMEGKSVEDDGEAVSFNIYAYNVQPGVEIDYATGESRLENGELPDSTIETYILNTKSMKFHYPTCGSASSISESNRREYTGDRYDLIQDGYSPCGSCKP